MPNAMSHPTPVHPFPLRSTKPRVLMSTRKSKVISIRVSAEEYRSFLETCRTRNLPSVSDLARFSMRQWIESAPDLAVPPPVPSAVDLALQNDVNSLRERIEVLKEELEILAERIKHRSRPTPPPSDH